MYLNFADISPSARYFAMVQSIIPRPIAWVLTENEVGTYNLAPFSFFTGVCSDPPLLMLSIGKKTTGDEAGLPKDTRANILANKKFVVHIPQTRDLNDVNLSAATLNHDESEVMLLQRSLCEFEDFPLPRLEDAAVAFACELYRMDEVGNTPQAIVYGEIKHLYIRDDIAVKDEKGRLKISAEGLDPLSRLGGAEYNQLGQFLRAARPE